MNEKIYLQEGSDDVVKAVLRGPAQGPFAFSDFEASLGVPPRPPGYEGPWHEWLGVRSQVLTARGLTDAAAESDAYVAWLKAEHGFEEVEWEYL